MSDEVLLTVPNVSQGREGEAVDALTHAVAEHASVLDTHSDAEHNRTVITAAGSPSALADALERLIDEAVERIDMRAHQGLHPGVGAVDVCPIVFADEGDHERARKCAEDVAGRIAERGIPVFLYGAMASSDERRERAFFRRGGPAELSRRMERGELPPDFGPGHIHERAGATLVTARPPIAAFNVELDTPNPEIARGVANQLRESGGGLPGVRALGMPREGGRSQVSMNIHDPVAVPLSKLVAEIRGLAEMHGAKPVRAELVGLIPEAAVADYPGDPPIDGFHPEKHVLERRLRALSG